MNAPQPSEVPQDSQRHREDDVGRRPGGAAGDRPAAPPDSAAAARDRVRELLVLAGVSLDSVTAADALLVTSELVTNAIRHGDGVIAFRADVADDVLLLSIADANPRIPVARTGTVDQPGGYGWPLIQRLTEHVDCSTRPDGKTITTSLRLS
ncbi:ATP-binding protein [Streptomyces sp. NRRL F-2664]|uniref:ATP-binding protein n=1 Tax=Streptomyces sp. NRRL F-2664 TaxID=1463842 RepID=UPI0007C6DA3D|nr:ATP-binding protein [Streptomyces sp. NRRL F-2664]